MNKIFKILLGVVLLSILYQLVLAFIFSANGYDITWQTRFTKKVGEEIRVNPFGFLSPIQGVASKKVLLQSSFVEKVFYPKAPVFNLVAPDSNTEKSVGQKITQVIKDSIKKINYNNSFNYDGSSFGVFFAHNPLIPELANQQITIHLIGTASAEAKKYGYEKSLKIGSYEPENKKLAEKRLARTKKILENNFSKAKLVITDTAYEVQLSHDSLIKKVLANPKLLDKDRYVEAQVLVTSERMEVIPFPSPWLLVIFFGFLVFLKRKDFRASMASTRTTSNQNFFDRRWVRYTGMCFAVGSLFIACFYLWGLFVLLCLFVSILFALCVFYQDALVRQFIVLKKFFKK